MIGRLLRRRSLRVAGPRCACRTCPNPKVDGLSKWCRDHTDAILVGRTLGPNPASFRRDAAVRVGARRWLLRAEVDLEREHDHAALIAEAAAQSPSEREINRRMWEHSDPGLAPSFADRIDEIVALSPSAERRQAAAAALVAAGFEVPDPEVLDRIVLA